tara:strand:- start:440 stop:748 length:309 start_codon:yes stop_codon:yes gene_type:complete
VVRANNKTKGDVMIKKINLGTANAWAVTGTPEEYTKHIAECGTEHEVTMRYMEPNPNGVGLLRKQRQETQRRYDMIVTRKGSCYHNHTCKECGISYDVDSSG